MPRYRFSATLEDQDLIDVQEPKRPSDTKRHTRQALVAADDRRIHVPAGSTSPGDRRATGHEDVLHPISARAVRERYHESVAVDERPDGCPVRPTGPAAAMLNDHERR